MVREEVGLGMVMGGDHGEVAVEMRGEISDRQTHGPSDRQRD